MGRGTGGYCSCGSWKRVFAGSLEGTGEVTLNEGIAAARFNSREPVTFRDPRPSWSCEVVLGKIERAYVLQGGSCLRKQRHAEVGARGGVRVRRGGSLWNCVGVWMKEEQNSRRASTGGDCLAGNENTGRIKSTTPAS